MAGSLNKVQLIGNLGRDPEIRYGQDGGKFASLNVATTERWRDKQTNEVRDRTEWHRVVVFNDKLAEVCEKYMRKGSRIYLEGQLQTRKWTDNTGAEKYTTEIVLSKFRGDLVLLDGRNDNQQSGGQQFAAPMAMASGDRMEPSFDIPASSSMSGSASDDLDDEIPF